MKEKYLDIVTKSSEEFLEENLICELYKSDNFLDLVLRRIKSEISSLKLVKEEAIDLADSLVKNRFKHALSGEFNKKTSYEILQLGKRDVEIFKQKCEQYFC